MPLSRRALIGIILAILGVAALPAASHSTAARANKHGGRCAKASRSKSRHAKRRAKCQKPKPRRTPEALSATLVIHLYSEGAIPVPGCAELPPAKRPEERGEVECRGNVLWERRQEEGPVRITRLGASGEAVGSLVTAERTVHVAPGVYEVTSTGGTRSTPQKVTVRAGQTLEVAVKLVSKA